MTVFHRLQWDTVPLFAAAIASTVSKSLGVFVELLDRSSRSSFVRQTLMLYEKAGLKVFAPMVHTHQACAHPKMP